MVWNTTSPQLPYLTLPITPYLTTLPDQTVKRAISRPQDWLTLFNTKDWLQEKTHGGPQVGNNDSRPRQPTIIPTTPNEQ